MIHPLYGTDLPGISITSNVSLVSPTYSTNLSEKNWRTKKIQQNKAALAPSPWRLKKHARMINFHRGISRLKRILLYNINSGETDLKSRDVERDLDSPPT
jgi:hypothetical protein